MKKIFSIIKFVLLFFAALIFYNEFLVFTLQSFSWNKLYCDSSDVASCVRILLVADPQILGERNEMQIARWDSDRYLKQTYSLAVSHAKPDLVVFLGDLMDEGSTATNQEYHRYMHRLMSIFTTEYPIKHLWIPGDNDIGGEEDDRLTKFKIDRFENAFLQPTISIIKNVVFYKANRITYDIPNDVETNDNDIRVVLSHIPLLFTPATFVDKVVETIRPYIIFSGHEHKSVMIDAQKVTQRNRQITPVTKDVFRVNVSSTDRMYEFVVPTCSYRMGQPRGGYGYAIIDTTEKMFSYTVLWQPSRFNALWNYIYLTTIVLVLSVGWCMWKVFLTVLLWQLNRMRQKKKHNYKNYI